MVDPLMKITIITGILSLSPCLAEAATFCIDGKYLVAGETRVINVFDEVAHSNLGNFDEVGGQQSAPIGMQLSGAGFGTIVWRNITNNAPPVRTSFLHDGDCIAP